MEERKKKEEEVVGKEGGENHKRFFASYSVSNVFTLSKSRRKIGWAKLIFDMIYSDMMIL